MTTQEIRQKYLDFMVKNGHKLIPRSQLVLQDDPTTLFTGSGMQPMIPYLLGQSHPDGKRLADSQPCLRSQDIDEVGDTSHTTFFEMLGNWSLGDYFKKEQIKYFSDFIFDELGLDPAKVYVSCYIGNEKFGIPRDTEAIEIWQQVFKSKGIEARVVEIGPASRGAEVGMQGGRIFLYDGKENWWSRAGDEDGTPLGDPCGPDSEVFYDFGEEVHDETVWGKAHPASDSPRFLEIGNNVFMAYKKTSAGFEKLSAPNVDFGAGLERVAAAVNGHHDVYRISLMWPIIEKLQELSGKNYESHTESMRVIADHMRGAVWLAADGVVPSNKQQGYVMRRLLRRAIRYAFELGVEQDLCSTIAGVVIDIYKDDYPELGQRREEILQVLTREEKVFRQTLRKGLNEFEKLVVQSVSAEGDTGMLEVEKIRSGEISVEYKKVLSGEVIFKLYDTYGFPVELSLEEAARQNIILESNWKRIFDDLMEGQRQRSQTAGVGQFKGGLADQAEETTKLHTATHLMYQAMREVLGDHVEQKGANITAERIRFDFSHPEKVNPEQIAQIEKIVNEKIAEDLPVTWKEMDKDQALKVAHGSFSDRYGDRVKVYSIGDYSIEVCGGPHVEHTGQLGEGGKKFRIIKEENSSAGVRRFKAILE